MIRRFRTSLTESRDDGVALVTVLGFVTVLTLLVGAGIAYAVGSQRNAKASQDWNAALAAAYAGIEEYQSRLADNAGYFRFGNPVSQFTMSTGSTVELPPAASSNPAFSLTEWATVPGSGGSAQFRYEVDNSKYYQDGTLRIRSTGKADGKTRSIVADLRQKGFIEFLYFTDYEILDPEISGANTASCTVYRYSGRNNSNPPGGCGTINFISADTINGPLHTNDGMQVCGSPKFQGVTTSAYPLDGSQRYYVGSACSNSPKFALNGGKLGYLPVLGMPETNSEMKKETRPDLPYEVPVPGCLYTGPTTVKLNDDATMTIKSPWTRWTSPVSGVNNPDCGTPGSAGLASSGGQRIPVKDNNLVYVQNVPSTPGDANYWAPGASGSPVCLPEDRSSSNGRNAAGNPVGFPVAGEYVANADVYGCRNGDAFIEGKLSGRMTVAAENYIYITDDVVYKDSEKDILGLVGQNAVFVHKPQAQSSTYDRQTNRTLSQRNSLVSQGYSCTPSGSSRYDCIRYSFSPRNADLDSDKDRRIDAAILSVAHTFMVQNYNIGSSRGTLTVNGAISQKFRGPVGTGSGGSVGTGYAKNYQYDERFRYTGPPKFLSPVTTTYGVNVWVEVSPVFNTAGNYR